MLPLVISPMFVSREYTTVLYLFHWRSLSPVLQSAATMLRDCWIYRSNSCRFSSSKTASKGTPGDAKYKNK